MKFRYATSAMLIWSCDLLYQCQLCHFTDVYKSSHVANENRTQRSRSPGYFLPTVFQMILIIYSPHIMFFVCYILGKYSVFDTAPVLMSDSLSHSFKRFILNSSFLMNIPLTQNRFIQEWNTVGLLWRIQIFCSNFIWNYFHWQN